MFCFGSDKFLVFLCNTLNECFFWKYSQNLGTIKRIILGWPGISIRGLSGRILPIRNVQSNSLQVKKACIRISPSNLQTLCEQTKCCYNFATIFNQIKTNLNNISKVKKRVLQGCTCNIISTWILSSSRSSLS